MPRDIIYRLGTSLGVLWYPMALCSSSIASEIWKKKILSRPWFLYAWSEMWEKIYDQMVISHLKYYFEYLNTLYEHIGRIFDARTTPHDSFSVLYTLFNIVLETMEKKFLKPNFAQALHCEFFELPFKIFTVAS